MLATLSRGSLRVKPAYICSLCLAHADSHSSTLALHRFGANGANFSTTTINWHGGEKDTTGASKAGEAGDGRNDALTKTTKPKGRIRRVNGRRTTLSTSQHTLSALRAALIAEDESKEVVSVSKPKPTKGSMKASTKATKSAADTSKPTLQPAIDNAANPPSALSRYAKRQAKKLLRAQLATKISAQVPKITTAIGDAGKTSIPKSKINPEKVASPGKKPKTVPLVEEDISSAVGPITTKSKKAPSESAKSKSKRSANVALNEKKPKKGGTSISKSPSNSSPVVIISEYFSLVEKQRRVDQHTKTDKLQKSQTFKDGSYQELKRRQGSLIDRIKENKISELSLRSKLVKFIQEGKLSGEDIAPAVQLLRSSFMRNTSITETDGVQVRRSFKNVPLSHKSSGLAPFRSTRPVRAPLVAPFLENSERSLTIKPKSPPGPVEAHVGMVAHEIKTINAHDLELVPVDLGPLNVPSLSYGLERVLFNPGVDQLQDPRSRVFNFDPYLQSIMPVSEFDFTALKQYITSSRDTTLLAVAAAEGKRYTGSTSSMTSALAHFHFLLSQWRPINAGSLSRDFPVDFDSFTQLQRAPVAIFLRYRDGVYAIDADKQFDNANILSMLGKSMEKLLTLSTEDFEKYRKQNSNQISEEDRNESEEFHYTTLGDFLLRSQLDAHDPRLPGTGMFDLKTRAVISIRMDTSQYEEGSGYEIRGLHGEWESFEREYYDMIRAAFLKYSLQIRMGRMDGIFVAFHNTERIFGFQYISLPEMDYALHGSQDLTTGDAEFKLSLDLLNRVLDRATAKFPGKSLRLHFETRPSETTPFMYIFAEPVEEQRIEEIQATNKADIEEFESTVLGLSKKAVDEQRKAEWDSLRARVEESMERDEEGVVEEEKSDEDLWDHQRRREEELLATAAQEDGSQDDADDDEEDELVEEEGDAEDEEDSIDETSDAEDGDEDPSHDKSFKFVEEVAQIKSPKEELVAGPGDTDVGIEHMAAGENSEEPLRDAESEDRKAALYETSQESSPEDQDVEESHDANDEENLEVVKSEDLQSEDLEPEESTETDETIATSPKPVQLPAQQTTIDPDAPVLGMVLVVRNKVNGEYVERPEKLKMGDKWTVEYALSEVPADRAQKLYEMVRARRAKVMDRAKETAKDDARNNQYIANLSKLSKQGRERRKKIDQAEKDIPIKLLTIKEGKLVKAKNLDVWEQEMVIEEKDEPLLDHTGAVIDEPREGQLW